MIPSPSFNNYQLRSTWFLLWPHPGPLHDLGDGELWRGPLRPRESGSTQSRRRPGAEMEAPLVATQGLGHILGDSH